MATWNAWLLVSAFLMTLDYIGAAVEEEAAFVRTPYAERHRAYAHRTGMFAPRGGAWLPPRFDWPWSAVTVAAIVSAIGLAVELLWELLRS